MKKKFGIIFTALVLILSAVFALVACDNNDTDPDSATSGEEQLPTDDGLEGEDESLPSEDGSAGEEPLPEVPEIPVYTIQFIGLNGDVIYTGFVEEGKTIELPEPKSYVGYEFIGWDVTSAELIATKDTSIYAIYKKLYSVTLEIYGLEEPYSETVDIAEGSLISSKITLEHVQSLLPEGYYIAGDYADPESYDRQVIEDCTIEIHFEKLKYTVTFNCNAGDMTCDALEVEHGNTFTLPSLSRQGYIFDGWYLDEQLSDEYSPAAVTENLVLYAKWTEITADMHIELASNDDIAILADNPHAQYTVTGEIDFSKIADANIAFSGVFDGGNKTASLGDKPLFITNSGTIRNLNVSVTAENAEINNISNNVGRVYGAICAYNSGTIENCSVTGSITILAEETLYAGGVCGASIGNIKSVKTDITITCLSAQRNSAIGGITGKLSEPDNSSIISDITADVNITCNNKTFCGGIAGNTSSQKIELSGINVKATIDGAMLAGGLVAMVSKSITLSDEITISTDFNNCLQYGDIIGFGGTADEGSKGATVTVNGQLVSLPIQQI